MLICWTLFVSLAVREVYRQVQGRAGGRRGRRRDVRRAQAALGLENRDVGCIFGGTFAETVNLKPLKFEPANIEQRLSPNKMIFFIVSVLLSGLYFFASVNKLTDVVNADVYKQMQAASLKYTPLFQKLLDQEAVANVTKQLGVKPPKLEVRHINICYTIYVFGFVSSVRVSLLTLLICFVFRTFFASIFCALRPRSRHRWGFHSHDAWKRNSNLCAAENSRLCDRLSRGRLRWPPAVARLCVDDRQLAVDGSDGWRHVHSPAAERWSGARAVGCVGLSGSSPVAHHDDSTTQLATGFVAFRNCDLPNRH